MSKKRGRSESVGGDRIKTTVGDRATNIAVGKNIHQVISRPQVQVQIAEADLAEVRRLFAELKQQVTAEAPPDKINSALERVGELEKTVTAEKPDLTIMEYVKKWFSKHLPQLAGAVVSVLVNPIVGKVVEAAGEIGAEQLKHHFGVEDE
jgi:hypothetical protein